MTDATEFQDYNFSTLPPGYRGWAMPCKQDPAAVWIWLSPKEMAGLTFEEAARKAELMPERIADAKHRACAAAWAHYEAAKQRLPAWEKVQVCGAPHVGVVTQIEELGTGFLHVEAIFRRTAPAEPTRVAPMVGQRDAAAEGALVSVERYDFSVPPPGGLIVKDEGMTAEQSLADAWVRHKACTDPPGLHVVWEPDSRSKPNGEGEMQVEASVGGPTVVVWRKVCRAGRLAVLAKDGPHEEARRAAWARYEACLDLESDEGSLLEDHDGAPVPAAPVWPGCLTWRSEDLASVERWRSGGCEPMPEVLRRRRMNDGTTEVVEEEAHPEDIQLLVERLDFTKLPPERVERFKTLNDPPGLSVTHIAGQGWCVFYGLVCLIGGSREHFGSYHGARAAAWAWCLRRQVAADSVDAVLVCERCGNNKPAVDAVDDKTCTQPWCIECDIEMGGLTDPWPECLTWTDEQVVEVEMWLSGAAVDLPEVLRG